METFLQDVRYAIRAGVKAPALTLVAMLTMAVAVGANTTVFGFINALLLSPPAGVQSPGTLFSVFTSDFSSGPYGTTSYPDYESMGETGLFHELAAFDNERPTLLRVTNETERVRAMAVTGNFFDVVGVRPLLGRTIASIDIAETATPAAAIGESIWRRLFAANPSVIGTTISLNGSPHVVVGIIPAAFSGLEIGSAFDIWVPLHPDRTAHARGNRGLGVVGRLGAETSITQVQSGLDRLAARLATAFPDTNLGIVTQRDQPRPFLVVRHTRMDPEFRTDVAMIGAILLAAVMLVLLIACANIAGLLMSRATARHREVAVRLALGASRGRLFRQMLTESLLLSAGGGAMGLLISLWTEDALPSFFPPEQARLLDVHTDWRVLGFTVLTTLASGVLFGLAPAIQGTRAVPAVALRGSIGQSGGGRGGARARKVLVAGQVSLAAVLLISAALLTRSLSNAVAADLGYSTDRAVLSTFEMPRPVAADQARAYFEALTTAVRAVPGVTNVALAQFVPVAGTQRRGFRIPGYTPRQGESTEFHVNAVSDTYFQTMGMTAVRGRLFEASDRAGRPVAVINHVLAQRYFSADPVGQSIRDSGGRQLEVIGVVRADRRLDLQDPPLPVVFYLVDQQAAPRLTLVAQTDGDPATFIETVRRAMTPVDRDVAIFRTVTLAAHLEEALAANRLTVALVTACGGMALALAVIGLYGVMSFTVARRTREIGVRVALGATPWHVLRLLLTENGGMLIIGLAAGTLAAVAATRLLGALLYGISATDAPTYGGVMIGLSVVALLANVVPARRALQLDPVAALRQE